MKKLFGLIAFVLSILPCCCAQQGQTSDVSNTQPLFLGNAKYVSGITPGYWPTCTNQGATALCAGLTLYVSKGTIWCQGTVRSYAGGTLSMANNATNYVYLDPTSNCAPASSTSSFTALQVPVAVVVTSSGVITAITDDRSWITSLSFPNINGLLQCAQLSAFTGDVTNAACAMTVQALHLSLTPTLCSSGNYARGIDANGNATGCTADAVGPGVKVNSSAIAGTNANFSDSTPAPGTNYGNGKWQKDTTSPDTNISVEFAAALDTALGLIKSATCSSHNWISSITSGTGAVGCSQPADSDLSVSDITTNNTSSTAHGFAPKSPADATKFLNGAATPAYTQVKDSDLSVSDITTNNSSTSQHGFLKKLDNTVSHYMDGTGNWSTPSGGGGGSTCSTGPINPIQSSGGTPTQLTQTISCVGSTVLIGVGSASSSVNPLTVTSCGSITGWHLIVSSVANPNKGWMYAGTTNAIGTCSISTNVNCSFCSLVSAEWPGMSVNADKTLADYSSGTSSINTSLTILTSTDEIVVSWISGFHTGWTASPTSPLTSFVTYNNADASNMAWYKATSASAQSFNWGITCCGATWWDDNVILNAAFTTTSSTGLFYQTVQQDGTIQTQRPILQLKSSASATVSCADNSGNSSTDCTISSPSGSAGALIKLCNVTASSVSEEDFTASANCGGSNPFAGTYSVYHVTVRAFNVSSNGAAPQLQFSTDSGSTWQGVAGGTTTLYYWSQTNVQVGTTSTGANGQAGVSSVILFADSSGTGLKNTATPGMAMSFDIYSPLDSSNYKTLYGCGTALYSGNSSNYFYCTGGYFLSLSAVNSFRIKVSSGTFSAVIEVYGYTN